MAGERGPPLLLLLLLLPTLGTHPLISLRSEALGPPSSLPPRPRPCPPSPPRRSPGACASCAAPGCPRRSATRTPAAGVLASLRRVHFSRRGPSRSIFGSSCETYTHEIEKYTGNGRPSDGGSLVRAPATNTNTFGHIAPPQDTPCVSASTLNVSGKRTICTHQMSP